MTPRQNPVPNPNPWPALVNNTIASPSPTVVQSTDSDEVFHGSGLGHEYPGMKLISICLPRTNFVTWSKAVYLALGAKSKIGYIDGSISPPNRNSDDYDKWRRVDCMVSSWLIRVCRRIWLNNSSHPNPVDFFGKKFVNSMMSRMVLCCFNYNRVFII